MTEDEAKAKRCCGPAICGIAANLDETGLMIRLCSGSACMAWHWIEVVADRAITRNITEDQETMVQRIKSHPHEMSIWTKPEGEPPMPPGEGWEAISIMKQSPGYLEGVYEREWIRKVRPEGYCGLGGRP